ncbi:hypothetical protein SEA_OLICIOUS_8 [Streptomyces phage Olicious]|uniref:Uncharacterized protein n=7 Tax=Immanueltrevirus immanuel3 TaxID=2846399 RepID=A0A2H5BMI5_9CAUD|nr:hypothetical protein HWB41_gp08 [Streptomyces phage Immanuel3]AUG87335.1 hypothetical protein SEA_HAUGEANATOR_8 [Streptomyces phage HaugeAnator]AUG87399.1 hypothetical protein SEA_PERCASTROPHE_8 [Streptomyces phage Percastrophe]AUG87463.1 hypothetical protein SEA_ROMERO_8 [Streptomyces phage Romero]AUG87527.1 hypothetical protein SEA_TORITOKI_8 [Streptomyces phage ToriToki]AUG87591.1 hypothetical protein SEA_ZOOBEAR_8 [Streptomyces phage ZooBear]AZF95818.1 hypothetical protein SEA_OLICIOUS
MDENLDYSYGGQWFDDMGALALTFGDAPVMGVSLGRSGVSRAQANDMAKNLLRANVPAYDDDQTPAEDVSDMTMEE